MTDRFAEYHPDETLPDSRAMDISLRQGRWLHVRRVLAFFIDYALYAALALMLTVVTRMLMENLTGIAGPNGDLAHGFSQQSVDAFYTLSTGLASLATLAIVIVYVFVTLGGRRQATLGMRALGLRLERLDNGKITGRYGIAHLLLFLATFTVFTPLILFAPFVLSNRQMLHDRLLDIVIQGSAENLLPAAKP
ncbi:RDD family protein [Nitratireductor rhodophyticola]|uniref:RDD family protein n=1 Tax=Nitratireductor rhodophyticola TaxID=2854036 RepID=UPI002AC99459|nr:RDD family protein [Nitratireductor rhodophyticola]WPZ13945.1 RDD family protein [Nitratireductor rhodophyticola]